MYPKHITTFIAISISTLLFSQKEDSLLLIVQSTDITTLKSVDEHADFLIQINTIDQGMRETMRKTHAEFGYGSNEYDSIVEKMSEIDRFLFDKIREYLSIHSHPEKEVGYLECLTPALIFHHVAGTPDDLDLKKIYFPTFYRAYQLDCLDRGQIWQYLFRLHIQLKGENYFNADFGEEEQIEEMIDLLELDRTSERDF